MKKSSIIFTIQLIFTIISIVFFVLLGIFHYQHRNNETVSQDFAEQLNTYPMPPHTDLLSKKHVDGKQLVSGNGGYWGVISFIHYSTSLSPKEVVAYYEKAPFFKYPHSQKKGVEIELYMAPTVEKVSSAEGPYYHNSRKGRVPISVYKRNPSFLEESEKYYKNHKKWDYVIQLTSDFDYLTHWD